MGRRCAALLAVAASFSAIAATVAHAEPLPGWELSGATYPANLLAGADQVETVLPSPESPTFTLSFEGEETAPLATNATAATVATALEALPAIGPGGVSVGERTEAGAFPVTFTGAIGDMQLPQLEGNNAEVTQTQLGEASGTVVVDVFNVGAARSSGTVTVTDVLPVGVKAKAAGELKNIAKGFFNKKGWGTDPNLGHSLWDCTGNGPGAYPSVAGASTVTCVNDQENLSHIEGGGGVPLQTSEVPYPQPPLGISVEASTGEGGVHAENHVTIAGGGALQAASTEDLITNTEPGKAGLTRWDAWVSNEDGTPDTQAGSHPYMMTTFFDFATEDNAAHEGIFAQGNEPRELEVQLPPGFIGNTKNIPQCKLSELAEGEGGECPSGSIVGTLDAETFTLAGIHHVFNMVPPPGEPAEFGFKEGGYPVLIDFTVRSGGDDGITAHIYGVPQKESFGTALTIWGVPNDKTHDRWRGQPGGCTDEELKTTSPDEKTQSYCTAPQFPELHPLLTLPTSCGEPQPFVIRELSGWQVASAKSELTTMSHDADDVPTAYTGCENLVFGPSITTTPEFAQADTATGLVADVSAPLAGLEDQSGREIGFHVPYGRSASAIKDTSVVLPAGLVINPGQAAGLVACTRTQAALEPLPGGAENDGPPNCPLASRIGTASAITPLIEAAAEKRLEGGIYILQSNPPDVKVLAALSGDGINVKLPLDVELNEQTGQITTRVSNAPQDPVSDFKLTFDGGAKAALVTPPRCGTDTTNADFTSWSSPALADVLTSSTFAVVEGAGGSACPTGALPFSPTLTAGTSSTEAGGFTSFSMLLARGDGQQRLNQLQFTSPAGLAALISSVPQCAEAQANAGTCPAASQIGHAIVASGPGEHPLVLPQPGAPELPIYLTGPYKGAPFGLSIVTPVIAGPFNLGTIVTRAKIEVDPRTAQVTVTTDSLPQIVKGVPTDIRSIDAIIDRPSFYFDPTSCATQQFTGTATGIEGTSAPLSSRFAVGACRALTFAPKFAASTQANGTFNRNGASLKVRIATKQGPHSDPAVATEANIKKVDVQLPEQLPSRLSTLQKACTEKQFALNPADCPEASSVGTAIVHTPVLPVPLVGPAYLVSHGGAAFPDLDLVLQGDGVTIVLTGSTNIKHGVTYSRFETTPDAPITSFELTLPERRYSALSAVGSLCHPSKTVTVKKRVAVRRNGHTEHVLKTVHQQAPTTLAMPTTITAQDGAVVSQTTKIAVSGCTKPKAKKSAKSSQRQKASKKRTKTSQR